MILVSYFTVSTGFVVNMHYCMDRFHSWQLGSTDSDKCATCGMSVKKNKCCHDQVKVLKLQQDAPGAYYFLAAFAAPANVPTLQHWMPAPLAVTLPRPATPIHGPPLLSKQDTYLRNAVFRI
ncbi:hypothetical protein GCM10028786_13480 [Flaviaesturariibacter terrae]